MTRERLPSKGPHDPFAAHTVGGERVSKAREAWINFGELIQGVMRDYYKVRERNKAQLDTKDYIVSLRDFLQTHIGNATAQNLPSILGSIKKM